jgi:hypothetical protein
VLLKNLAKWPYHGNCNDCGCCGIYRFSLFLGGVMKSATSFSRSGVSDWIAQRVSAVILAVYFVVIVGWLLMCKRSLMTLGMIL